MKFNKFGLINSLIFLVAFILILLNFISPIFNYVAIGLFIVASSMLSITSFKYCKTRNAILSNEQEEVLMELCLENGEEKYVPVEKKKSKFREFRDNLKIFSPFILSIVLTCFFVLLLVLSLVKIA